MQKPTLEQMWSDLQKRGWSIRTSHNPDGDAYTALMSPRGTSVARVWAWNCAYYSFQEEITAEWKALQ